MLSRLGHEHPSFPGLALTRFRVHVLQAVRAGELSRAREIVATRTVDLPLPPRDETLADILAVTSAGAASAVEIERLKSELRGDGELRAWLANVWPDGETALTEAMARAS